jgi:hypothetical protein
VPCAIRAVRLLKRGLAARRQRIKVHLRLHQLRSSARPF